MQDFDVYIPYDRRFALAHGVDLPDRAFGTALFADISGFTPLTEALAHELGPQRGAEELTTHLNRLYEALIRCVQQFGGSVIGFSGDAITCWFDAKVEGRKQKAEDRKQTTLRAVACGLAMQQAMRGQNALTTPGGARFALAVKVAVARGPARRFLVGDPHIQVLDVLAGHTLDRLALAGRLAQRGEVVLDAQTAAELADLVHVSNWRAADAEQRVAIVSGLRHAPRAAAWPGALAQNIPAEIADTWLLPAVRERMRRHSATFLAELRPVVALMLHFQGIDYDHDDHAGQRLNSLICAAQQIAAHYGGALIDLTMGDKGSYLYMTFGAPIAHDDDAARALAAARDLLALPQRLPFVTAMRIGLARGTMHAGAYGGTQRRTYGVLGDPDNLAARLMEAAPDGTAWCDYAVYRAAERQWMFEALKPVRVKGKASMVRVYQPIGRHDDQIVQKTSSHTLIGRQIERIRIAESLDAISIGASRVLLLDGEAGIGKSRMVAELARQLRAHGFVGLVGTGHSIEQQTPYRAWRDIFSAYFGVGALVDREARRARVQAHIAELLPELSERLPLLNDILDLALPETELTHALDAQLRSESLVDVLVSLLRAWAKEHPLILVLEDAHWLDSRSWELAVRLARALAAEGLPLLLVVTIRPLESDHPAMPYLTTLLRMPGATRLRLGALSESDTVSLVAAKLNVPPTAVPAAVAELVQTYSNGNPFFAEELVAALQEQGLIQIERHSDDPAPVCVVVGELNRINQLLPDTLHGLLLARIDRLPLEYQFTLKIASVIGTVFDYEPLRYARSRHLATDAPVLKQQLRTLAVQDFTELEAPEPGLAYRFKHVLTQEAAYQTLLYAQRRELHRTLAEWYETMYDGRSDDESLQGAPQIVNRQSEIVNLLVHHYRQAEDAERERHYAWLAGIHAADQYAHAEAVTFLTRALELTCADAWEDRYQLLLARAKVYDLQGAREAQRQDLAALEQVATMLDDRCQAEVAERQAHFAHATGDYPTATRAACRAVTLAMTSDIATIAVSAYQSWAWALVRQGNYADARQQASAGLELARQIGDRQGEGDSLITLGGMAEERSDYALARSFYEQGLRIFQDIGNHHAEAEVFLGLGVVVRRQGDFATARAYLEQSLRITREIGNRRGEGWALNILGAVVTDQEAYLTAQDFYEQSLRIFRAVGDRSGEALALNNLGHISGILEDYAARRAFYEQSLRVYQAGGDQRGESFVLINLGFVASVEGAFDAARDHLTRCLHISRAIGYRWGESVALANLGLTAHLQNENSRAVAHLHEALQIVREIGEQAEEAAILTYLGHAELGRGQLAEAGAAYRAALELRNQLAQPILATEPLAGLAQVALATDDIIAALAHVSAILVHLERSTLAGTDEPLRVYYTCYQILRAAGDSRADDMIETAYRMLMAQASTIGDMAQRRSFLEHVPYHRAIMAAWSEQERMPARGS